MRDRMVRAFKAAISEVLEELGMNEDIAFSVEGYDGFGIARYVLSGDTVERR